MTSLGIYAGSFDPFTHGHQSVLDGALKVFGHVIIAIGTNHRKKTLFTADERKNMIAEHIHDMCYDVNNRCSVDIFDGLLIDYAKAQFEWCGRCSIVRGLRAVNDFEAEMSIADVNRRQCPEIQTVFIPTEANAAFISSSAVKELALYPNSDLSHYVRDEVAVSLRLALKSK